MGLIIIMVQGIMAQSITVIATKNIIGMVASIIINTMASITDMINTTVTTTDVIVTKNIIEMVASIIRNIMVGITDMIITTVTTTDMVIIHISIIDQISIVILVGISAILVMDTGVMDTSGRVNIRIHRDIEGKMWFGMG